MREIKLSVYGPLVAWSLLFMTSAVIKAFAFRDHLYWINIPSEISLWALGVLFTLSASEQTYYNARLVPKVTKQKTGYSVEYGVTISDSVGFTPKYLYLFLIGIPVWIWTMLIGGSISRTYSGSGIIDIKILFLSAVSYFIAFVLVFSAIRVLHEVSK